VAVAVGLCHQTEQAVVQAVEQAVTKVNIAQEQAVQELQAKVITVVAVAHHHLKAHIGHQAVAVKTQQVAVQQATQAHQAVQAHNGLTVHIMAVVAQADQAQAVAQAVLVVAVMAEQEQAQDQVAQQTLVAVQAVAQVEQVKQMAVQVLLLSDTRYKHGALCKT
jgi:hypothetical protein